MLNQQAKDENKLPDLQVLLSNLEDEKHYIKQTTKFNLAQSQHTITYGILLGGGSSSRA